MYDVFKMKQPRIVAVALLATFLSVFSMQSAQATVIAIDTCAEFQNITADVAADYVLTSDIDCSGIPDFTPIDNFTGTFDGQNYTVSNMTISTGNGQAPFGSTSGATIQNVMFVDSSINANYIVAGVVGSAADGTTIQNVHFSGTLVSGAALSVAGGIAGQISDSTIRESSADVTITGYSMIGGLVGGNNGTSEIHESYATGTISGSSSAGASNIGGLVGLGSGDIYNSYATTAVSGNGTYTGGLAGNVNGDGVVENSYATGAVTNVSADVGGLVGGLTDTATASNSFWDTDTTLMSTSDGGTGKTTVEMKDIATFTETTTPGLTTAWDFLANPGEDMAMEGIWDIDATVNDGYPTLTWGDDEVEDEIIDEDEVTEELENNQMEPVNNPATGAGDGSGDTVSDLGKPLRVVKAENSMVTVFYKKGESKLFRCFANDTGIPKARVSKTKKGTLLCYSSTGKKVRTFNAFTGKRMDTHKLASKAFTKYQQDIFTNGKNKNTVVFFGKRKKKIVVQILSLNLNTKKLRVLKKATVPFSTKKQYRFRLINAQKNGQKIRLVKKGTSQMLFEYNR